MKAKQILWKLSLVFVSLLFVLATAFGLLNIRDTKTVKASGESVSVYMLDGASIRYDGENSGIRFTAYVSESSLTAGTDVTVGMTIVSSAKTWERTSDADTWQWATSDIAGYKKFQVALTGIPASDYGTELTATAWVDVDGVKTNATAQTRSIARVANACLAENELLKELGSEEVLTDTKVSTLDGYTTGEALASVSSIEMSNNTFAWGEVTNATGYFVGFSGEVVHVIGGTAVPVSAFGKIATPVDGVSVIAYGNGVDNTYGEVVSGSVFIKTETLATFADVNNGTISNLEGFVKGNVYREDPTYVDGSVKAGFYVDRYHVGGSSSSLAAFKVTLPTGLDLTKDGIVVKVQLYDRSNVATMDRFTLLSKDGQKSWQNGLSTDFPGIAMTYQAWMEVKLSSADLQSMGYATGDTELYFGGWNATTVNVSASSTPGMWFQLDEISYYTSLANFSDGNNGTISNIAGYKYTEFKTAPTYENGTVKFKVLLDNYAGVNQTSDLTAFKVTLPVGLDFSKSGIEIRLNNYDGSNTVVDTVSLLKNGDSANWNSADKTALPNVAMNGTEWVTLQITTAQLVDMGYADGATELYFGAWITEKQALYNGYNEGIQIDYIRYCESFVLSTPTDVTVSTKGLIEWNGDVNADKYIVDIDGTQYETTTNRYQMDEFTADVTVKVQAISDGEYWADSLWSEIIATDYFPLASFADANNGTVELVEGYRAHTWKEAPSYTLVEGTVSFGVLLNSYDTTSNVASSLAAFKVNLPKGLDLSFDGIEILANSYDGSGTPSAFSILKKGDNANWCTTDKSTLPNVAISTNEWVTLQITSAQLGDMGYANGDTELYLGVWLSQAYGTSGGYNRRVRLDYIQHYNVPTLLTPENVTVSDTGLIEWTEVNNADGYIVEIDGTEYTSDNNSYQIQAFAKDVTVKVRAISNGEYWSASPWTEEVTTNYFMLADFSDANNGKISGLEGYVFGTASYRDEPFYEDGTVKAGIKLDRYDVDDNNSTTLAAFKVTLPTGLDLTKGGIVVKVQLYDRSNVAAMDRFTLLRKDGQSTWQSCSSTDFPGIAMTYKAWMEVKLSSADLQSMGYATGDTELYFGGWNATTVNVSASSTPGMWFQLDEINYYNEYTLDQLAEQIAYDDTQAMELGAYIAPTSAILMNWNATAYNANNIYQAAGLNSFNIVVTTDSVFEDIDLALTRCGLAQIDTYLQLHNGMTADVNGWTKFQALFSGVDFTEYPYLKGFFIADEPSWTQMEVIETYYVPWFNENYAKSDLEFCVNLLGGYSTAMGALRDINGNSLDRYEGTEQEYRDCHTAYVNEWLGIFATVKSSNKSLTLDSYPLMDNQTGLLTEFDGSNLPAEGYERVLYDDWLRQSMNMANFARDNGHTFGAFIQAFDESGTDKPRTYRLPSTLAEIKWQAYMNIALGAKHLTYYGFDARSGGHYMTASGAQPTAIYDYVQATNAELATLDHVFMAFDTWVGAKTFIPSGATASTAIAGVADIELGALTNLSDVTTDGELVVGEMVDNHGNHGYMLVGYNDPFDGVSTEVSMTFDGADGFIVYRAGDNVRTFVKDTNGLLSLTLGAGEGVFVIPVYAK